MAKAKNAGKRTPLDDLAGGVVALAALISALVRARRCPPAPATAATTVETDRSGERVHQRSHAPKTGVMAKLDGVGRRVRPLGVALKVNERYGELHGNFLAGAITLQAFLSLFPLLLVALSVAGFVAAGSHTDVAGQIISRFGLNGEAATAVVTGLRAAERSRKTAGPIGFVGLLWSGLGLVGALQYAYDQVWQVEARGMKDRAIGLLWLVGAAILFLLSAVITTVLGYLPGILWPVGIVASLATNVALWLWTAKLLPNRDVGWRPLLPGAILGGIGLEALKLVGRFYVPHLVASSSAVYGSLGVVFAILAWLFVFGRLVVYSATLNVVLWEEKHGTVTAEIDVPADLKVAPHAA
ncbi:MAG TPA: YihY/virulence factor BrkB family protein [Acidimicrobiales bacterium]|nr:YihY/virulence factor BrkB family protein [Acidimicrobiales bacterium]